MKLNRTEVLERFAKMIRLRTVSHADGRGTDAAAFAAAHGIPVFPDFPAFVRDLLSRIPDGPEKKK